MAVTKMEMYKMSEEEGAVNIVGKLNELIPNKNAEWTGGVSVARRLEAGEISNDDIVWLRENISKFFVKTTPGATVGCIDGRIEAGYDDNNPAQFNAKLGPKIPGGTLAGGVSSRHAASSAYPDFENANIADDAKNFGEKTQKAGYQAGDHSAHSKEDEIGCAAWDGVKETHAKVNPSNLPTIYGLTKAVLATDFNEVHFTHFVSSANMLAANDAYFESKQEAVEYLTSINPDGLPELDGKHNELMLVINRVEGTTLHRDHLNAETGEKIQAFNYDLWYTERISKELFPDSIDAQARYVHCRLAMAVAAMMYITDGSLDVAVRDAHEHPLAA